MTTALIGYSGFVGQTLMKQTTFNDLYRSNNISDIENKSYDLIVGAGAPAKKWLANKDPITDAATIDQLINHLSTVEATMFILISTVDVFKSPSNVDETTSVDTTNLHAYGYNRWRLEEFVKKHFKNHLIIRLPGLVGTGLKKNIIFDFLNNNQIDNIESRNIFQFYPMNHLWNDIQIALKNNLSLVHLTAEPLDVGSIAKLATGKEFINHLDKPLVSYNMKSIYANLWNKLNYQYSKDDCLEAIQHYFETEVKTL